MAGLFNASYGSLIKQGAEAHVYKSTHIVENISCLVKIRPIKSYRHPTLDSRLTKHRCISEARLLHRCRSMGIPCPALFFVDEANGEIIMEWVEGPSIRDILNTLLTYEIEGSVEQPGGRILGLMKEVGATIGKLHSIDIIHGDLTTSNLMLRRIQGQDLNIVENLVSANDRALSSLEDHEVVLIDFGLGHISTNDEDKAVDLYVLERAFLSTHPKACILFDALLASYQQICPGSHKVLKRLQEVRLRGRKKNMVG